MYISIVNNPSANDHLNSIKNRHFLNSQTSVMRKCNAQNPTVLYDLLPTNSLKLKNQNKNNLNNIMINSFHNNFNLNSYPDNYPDLKPNPYPNYSFNPFENEKVKIKSAENSIEIDMELTRKLKSRCKIIPKLESKSINNIKSKNKSFDSGNSALIMNSEFFGEVGKISNFMKSISRANKYEKDFSNFLKENNTISRIIKSSARPNAISANTSIYGRQFSKRKEIQKNNFIQSKFIDKEKIIDNYIKIKENKNFDSPIIVKALHSSNLSKIKCQDSKDGDDRNKIDNVDKEDRIDEFKFNSITISKEAKIKISEKYNNDMNKSNKNEEINNLTMQNIKKNQKNNYYNIEINKNQTNVASKLNQKSPNKRIREGIMYDNFIYKEQCRKRNNT